MSMPSWLQSVEAELRRHDYMAGVERTVERVKATGEVFTPTALVLEMCEYLGVDVFAPGKTVLDPACGDGQFLVAAKTIKMTVHGMSEGAALSEIYGVDIMRDNVDLCKKRLRGGTIVMGNTLDPTQALEGQTQEELSLMVQLFEEATRNSPRKKKRLARSQPLHEARHGTSTDSEMLLF